MARKITIALAASVLVGLATVSTDAMANGGRGRHHWVHGGYRHHWAGYGHGYGWHGYGPSGYSVGAGLAGLWGYPGGFCYILTPYGVQLTC